MTTSSPAKKTSTRRKPAAKKTAKAPFPKATYLKWHRDMLLMRRFVMLRLFKSFAAQPRLAVVTATLTHAAQDPPYLRRPQTIWGYSSSIKSFKSMF